MLTTIQIAFTSVYSYYRKTLARLNGEPQSFVFNVTNYAEGAPAFFQVATPNGSRGYEFEVIVEKRGVSQTFHSTLGSTASLRLKIENAPLNFKITVNLPTAKKDWRGRFPYSIFAVEAFRRQIFDKVAS